MIVAMLDDFMRSNLAVAKKYTTGPTNLGISEGMPRRTRPIAERINLNQMWHPMRIGNTTNQNVVETGRGDEQYSIWKRSDYYVS